MSTTRLPIRKIHPLLYVMSVFLIVTYLISGINFLVDPALAAENPQNRFLLEALGTTAIGVFSICLALVHATGLLLNKYSVLLAAYIGGAIYLSTWLSSYVVLGLEVGFDFLLAQAILYVGVFLLVIFTLIKEPPIRDVVAKSTE